jgi:hypothetical protein
VTSQSYHAAANPKAFANERGYNTVRLPGLHKKFLKLLDEQFYDEIGKRKGPSNRVLGNVYQIRYSNQFAKIIWRLNNHYWTYFHLTLTSLQSS